MTTETTTTTYEIFHRTTGASWGRFLAASPEAAIQALLDEGGVGDSGTSAEHFEAIPVQAEALYSVVRRSSNARSMVTGEPEIRAYGAGTATLWRALVEADARNLLLGEAERDRWEVVGEDGKPLNSAEIAAAAETVEPADVADFLIAVLGVAPAEAQRLVA